MPRAAVVLAEGFEEIEAVTCIDVLRRGDIEVEAVGLDSMRVCGAHGVEMVADLLLDNASGPWDVIVLPGGMPGASTLRDSVTLQNLVREQNRQGGWLAAICAAPIVLGAAGLLQGRRATCYPGFENQLVGAYLENSPVVRDHNLITSRGPATAFAFALTIVECLRGPARANELASALLVNAG